MPTLQLDFRICRGESGHIMRDDQVSETDTMPVAATEGSGELTPPTFIKRIVLQHPSGLHQILGRLEPEEAVPEFVDYDKGVTIEGKPVALNLVTVKGHYILYRPLMLPSDRPTFKRR